MQLTNTYAVTLFLLKDSPKILPSKCLLFQNLLVISGLAVLILGGRIKNGFSLTPVSTKNSGQAMFVKENP
jgi:hypothetical protein